MSMSESLKPMNMLPYMTKGVLKIWLSERSWDGEIILDYPGRPNIIIGPLYRRCKRVSVSEGGGTTEAKVRFMYNHRQLLETRKAKEMGSFLEPPEGTQPCWPLLDFWHPVPRKVINCDVLSH